MSYPHIAARLYQEPWLMLPGRYQELCRGFESARQRHDRAAADDPVGPVGEDFFTGEVRAFHPQVETHGPLALARVHGITGKGLSRMEMMCGGFDTGLFRQQLANIAEDSAIRALVIDFDTPGGMAAGNAAAADAIRAVAASGKKVIGYTSGMCCSAGYWMAAACDELHAEADSIVGSISTIYSGIDSSKNWAMNGLELKLFATGKFKATGMAGKQWTPEEEENIWQRVRAIDDEFKAFVSTRRGIHAENMEGQWWYARHAPATIVNSTRFPDLESLLEATLEIVDRG
jgi:ClpP class serine protease